ncbi:alpha/beta hydrolase [Microbacterium proteolyticum]|uniref:alpha/beta hydrolase n=1 Tax=Microbacterium proteolyticum TaxID=1572644 RepID=UPI002417B207|nr:alpha/beta hydrolase [Microbacterium proteolyticum]
MSTPTVADLPLVVEPDVLTGLGDRLVDVANEMQTSMSDVHARWNVLRDADVFHVAGTDAVPQMLDRPAADARSFAEALVTARNALWEAGSVEFADLKKRREELSSRIPGIVADYSAAVDATALADATYRSTRGDAVDPSVAADAALARLHASTTLSSAESALDSLRSDIDTFRRDVEDAEDRLAARLRGVTGGTEVTGAGGEPVRVAQLFWGFSESPYPGAPSAAAVSRSLAEQLTYDLGRSAERRIDWLATADREVVARWLDGHPDFVQAVAFIDAQRADDLFADLAGASTAGPDGEWNAGALGQLMALAPLVVGNLNGIPVAQRGMFNLAGLAQIERRDDLDDETRSRLVALKSVLDRRGRDGSRPALLSLFLDTDGSPRANIAFGDVESADQVTTLTHGIRTSLQSVVEWSNAGANLQSALTTELKRTGSDRTAAVVLVMDWDSGGIPEVLGIDRPDAGAARLSETLKGIRGVNPSTQIDAGAHSLGTTMTSQAIADNPGLVSHVWFFGSAGVTEQAGDSLADQIRSGQLSVNATHADADPIAAWGRKDWLGSTHAEDPRDVPGVSSFSSDGGVVPGFGSVQGEFGEGTDSHDTANSMKDVLVGWTVGPGGAPIPRYESVEQTGYLDPSAESFKHFVVGLREALETAGANE